MTNEDFEFEQLERRIARQSIGVTHDAVDIVRPVDDASRNAAPVAVPVFMSDQRAYSPATADITINWRKKYGWVPASELPEIAAKHRYFRERQWLIEPAASHS